MLRSLLTPLFLLMFVACGSGESSFETVFVPTAQPFEPPTATPAPTPTLSADLWQEYFAFCDGQLRGALLEIKGPWNLGEVWDYAMHQVDDCKPPYWFPRPGSDEGLELVSVAGVDLLDDLRYRNGRGVNGAVRVSFAEGRPGGDGYHHWYFDPVSVRWYSGDYVVAEREAAPHVSDLPLGVKVNLAEGCWSVLETRLAESFGLGGNVDRHVAAMAVLNVQRGTWRCIAEIWSPIVVDAGQMDEYCGYVLPGALRAGPGVSGDGSFRMDFRDDGGNTRSLVYLSVASSDSSGLRAAGYLACG